MNALPQLGHGGGIASTPLASPEKVNAPQSGKSPRNVARPIFPRKCPRETAAEYARDIISVAFGGPSENAVCERAAAALGRDEGTIRSILRMETKRVDFALVLAAIQFLPDPLALPKMREFIAGVVSK